MNGFKEKCIKLRRSDHTILEISKITGRPKSSVYFHTKDIPLSLEKQKNIRINSAIRISAISAARKGKSNRKFKKFTKWDEGLVSLISHLMFDGEIKRSGCFYNNRNQSLLDKIENLMKLVYEFKPVKYLNPLTGVKRIFYFNVALAIYLKKKSAELLNKIDHFPKHLKKEFLIAFFDDEGCIDFRIKKHLRRVRGYQKNINILILIQKLLRDFSISSAIHKPNEIVIMGKENLEKFRKEIGFSSGVYINGNRSNSIWKKSIEKRILLNRAINSFKV